MKLLNISLFLLLFFFSTQAHAQNHEKFEKRVEVYKNKWQSLIPTHLKLQYAGSMGFLSIGTGWDYGKKAQWETDLIIGYVPPASGDKAKVAFTIKQNYIPWKVKLGNEKFFFEPLTTGLYVNTISGRDFWSTEPERYPSGYYNMSTKIRFHIFLGERLTYRVPPERRWHFKEITFFYEISTCDLYIASAVQNSYLKPHDYLKLSLGVKFQIF